MGGAAAFGLLVSSIGCQSLQPPLCRTAGGSAVALTAIATDANDEYRMTGTMTAMPLSQQLARIQWGRHAAILPWPCWIPKRSGLKGECAIGADDAVRLRLMRKKLRFLMRAYSDDVGGVVFADLVFELAPLASVEFSVLCDGVAGEPLTAGRLAVHCLRNRARFACGARGVGALDGFGAWEVQRARWFWVS